MCIGGAFGEVFEPGSVLANGLLVHVRHEWGSPLARSGQGLELDAPRRHARDRDPAGDQ